MAESQKALTKEDLIYILQTVFRLADEPDNAIQKNDDGLYVKDYHDDLNAHENDSSVHVTQSIREVLDKISVDDHGNLLYDGKPATRVSEEADNAIQMKDDGLYVKDEGAAAHIQDADIHVTKDKKEEWDTMLDEAKAHCISEIGKIAITKIEIVTYLPTDDISSETLYFLLTKEEDSDKYGFVLYIYAFDKWWPCIMSEEKLQSIFKEDLHYHDNKDVIDLFDVDDAGRLQYNGKDIFQVACKDDPTNAAKMVDGLLYIKDFTQELKSLETCSTFAKVNLYSDEISNSGKYQLKESIDDYNLIMVEYYYKPDKEGEPNGCAKTAVIDTDVLNFLYQKGMDYMLEYGYGILTSNSKIRMHEDMLWVDYYHNVCIYRITGIRKGDD